MPSLNVTTDIKTEAEKIFEIKDLGLFLSRVFDVALAIASILVIVYFIWGGIEWILSGGDKTKYEAARNKITSAIIGLVILACSWLLWKLIIYFLGIGSFSQGGVHFDFYSVTSP